MRAIHRLLFTAALFIHAAVAQSLEQKPDLPYAKPNDPAVVTLSDYKYRAGFLQNWDVISFGLTAAPVAPGYEFLHSALTGGSGTTYGLECQRCLIRSPIERNRYPLPPFGMVAIRWFAGGRARTYLEYGGINAWKPDNSLIERSTDRSGTAGRSTSYNDAWLVQTVAGGRFAVDPNRRLWVGPAGRYFQSFGTGKKHWNSIGGTATFLWGK